MKPAPEIEELRQRMSPYFYATDTLADAVVEDFSRMRPGEGSAVLALALSQGIEKVPHAPVSVRELFADLQRTPLWVDWMRSSTAPTLLCERGPSDLLR